MIPEGWKKTLVGSIAEINPDNIGPSWPYQHLCYVDISSVGEGILISPPRCIEVSKAPSRAQRLIKTGDIILSLVRPRLRSMFLASNMVNDWVVSTGFAVLRPKESIVIPGFLYACCNNQSFTDYLVFREKGAAYPAVSSDDVQQAPILLPPLPEQRAIVEVLSTWDRAIELTSQLIEAKKKLKHGLMQQLLTGKKRFPEFEGQEWTTRPFSEFLSESREPVGSSSVPGLITIRLYGMGAVEKENNKPRSKATICYRRRAGQLVYSKLDFLNGAFAIVPSELDGYVTTSDLPAFDISEDMDRRFLLDYLTRRTFYKGALRIAHGGRKARRVHPYDFLKTKAHIPPLPEQRRIADVLDAVSNEIELLERGLDATKRQKKGLMQKLLTGQVRVKVEPRHMLPTEEENTR